MRSEFSDFNINSVPAAETLQSKEITISKFETYMEDRANKLEELNRSIIEIKESLNMSMDKS